MLASRTASLQHQHYPLQSPKNNWIAKTNSPSRPQTPRQPYKPRLHQINLNTNRNLVVIKFQQTKNRATTFHIRKFSNSNVCFTRIIDKTWIRIVRIPKFLSCVRHVRTVSVFIIIRNIIRAIIHTETANSIKFYLWWGGLPGRISTGGFGYFGSEDCRTGDWEQAVNLGHLTRKSWPTKSLWV